ncbi:hypothetical protein SAMN05443144_12016 [Fodinibius roseus]|uniref:Uncharacterized protein n=1 Tax=Fodinibius roseus TaxID=1194090 RepID=A0A1M5HEE2_9BACT|nr:hypothetical protein [Fodinibius roseus]SHG14291.1 hypothetical protein SAMN05443144_12016 [Fodinibius roseus]
MLLRLVTVISLIQFLLLMISGESINIALYRSLLVFLILFSLVYLSIFLLNIIQDNKTVSNTGAQTEDNNPSNNSEEQ